MLMKSKLIEDLRVTNKVCRLSTKKTKSWNEKYYKI